MRAELQTALGEGYRVGPRIGRGGSATIYAARDLHLGRDVAVKVLDPMVEAPEVRERFRREARAVARLRHPNVVPIFLVSERPGLSYFVMPLIEGASLAAVLAREGPLSIEEARRVLLEAASGLEAAHRAGIVHRDIKPENVMLEGPDRRVVLMDFGIARAIDGDERKLTMDGALVGTPEYMSPEQAAADPAVDARSDVDFAHLSLLGLSFGLAAQYYILRSAGYSWVDILRRSRPGKNSRP